MPLKKDINEDADKKKKVYKCRRCGVPLKGHTCQLSSSVTQILAPSHVLFDHLHGILRNGNHPPAEREFLLDWTRRVHERLTATNDLALQNIELGESLKSWQGKVRRERDEMVALKARLIQVRSRIEELEQTITSQKDRNVMVKRASQLLDRLDEVRSKSK